LKFFISKSSFIHSYCVRREPDNFLNEMNVIVLERIRLGASFEQYTGIISCVLTFLRWMKMILYRVFSLKKLVYRHIFMIFFLKASVHKWMRRDLKNCPNDMNPSALEKRGLGASFESYGGFNAFSYA